MNSNPFKLVFRANLMKKALVSLALGTFLLAGCTATVHFGSGKFSNEVRKQNSSESRPHTTSEKYWFAGMAACHAADYYSTKVFLDKGLEEGNPTLGKHPSNEEVMTLKLLSLGLFYILGQKFPEDRELIYQVGSGMNCGAAVWNMDQTRKYGN